MIVLGIDPGTTRIGYGVVNASSTSVEYITSGVLKITKTESSALRLRSISLELEKLLKLVKPEKVGVERLFFAKNKKTALSVAEARGVIIEKITSAGIILFEPTPNEVKIAVTGSGTSSKSAVAKMVSIILKIKTVGLLDDETDALAIAISSINKRVV
ncbi:MAG: crossover junction endodeoxyribonuclease RuvC [Candidatus Jorgensenbacteria bacterium]|nr:crossover junction endodeoxyribonuclease RuvC [Candidatus Jorgensenbacteria bacterium]